MYSNFEDRGSWDSSRSNAVDKTGIDSPMHRNARGVQSSGDVGGMSQGSSGSGNVTSRMGDVAGLADLEAAAEKPPAGCAPNAIKLFVGNIPKSCTEVQLLPFFETIGKVVDLVIVRDKASRESKGSAFLWYATRTHAEQAILQFNMRHSLPDPTGQHTRPLVLRKAKPRTRLMCRPLGDQPGMEARSSMTSLGPGSGQLQADFSNNSYRSGPITPSSAPHSGGSFGTASINDWQGADNSSGSLVDPLVKAVERMQMDGGNTSAASGANMYQGLARYASSSARQGGSRGQGQLGQTSADPLWPAEQAQKGQVRSGPVQVSAEQTWAAGQTPPMSVDALSADSRQVVAAFPLTRQQVSTVFDYMHSVQAVSGAQLNVTILETPGLFQLVIRGVQMQVEAARSLLGNFIGFA